MTICPGTIRRLALCQPMENSDSEGLGLSLFVYMAAILGTVAILAIPVYFVTKPDVYANPALAQSDPLRGPIVGAQLDAPFPLARLERAKLAEPTTTAGLSARVKKAEPEHRVTHRVARRPAVVGTPVAELQPERKRPAFFFGLFGG